MNETVSVIVPAYNAAKTIDETLMSVRSQSWRDLEIIVVDDGSTDDTRERAERHAAEDARVRVIRQPNGGVAAARNRGVAEAAGDLVAPVDADDLWRPTKIEKQLVSLRAAGEAVALVYTWFATIDEAGRIIAQDNSSDEEGNVLRRMCMGNLVGNGSSPLMRKQAVVEAGGYDSSLRAQGAEGCEDLKLYFTIAECHRFAVVREHLTGYRWTPENMSSDGRKMLRSYDLVMDPLRAKYPQYMAEFEWGRTFLIGWLFDRAVKYGGPAQCWALYRELLGQHALMACRRAVRLADRLWRHRWFPRDPERLPFLEGQSAT
jgi:glycosyltransferase involved in cell wall biosynthesis